MALRLTRLYPPASSCRIVISLFHQHLLLQSPIHYFIEGLLTLFFPPLHSCGPILLGDFLAFLFFSPLLKRAKNHLPTVGEGRYEYVPSSAFSLAGRPLLRHLYISSLPPVVCLHLSCPIRFEEGSPISCRRMSRPRFFFPPFPPLSDLRRGFSFFFSFMIERTLDTSSRTLPIFPKACCRPPPPAFGQKQEF